MTKKLIIIFAFIFSLQGFSQKEYLGDGPYSQLIIRGVMLINGDGSPPRGPMDIVVENNKIVDMQIVGYPGVKINEKKRPILKKGGKELDANGMYLLPGFIDMHGHIGGEAQGANPEYVFKLWMSHGVTTVRQPSGRNAIELKRQSAENKIVAPRIFEYTGFGSGSKKPITTVKQAKEWVRVNAENGADGIKFFGAEPEIMAAAIEENKKLGLRSTAHHAQLSVARWNVLHSARAGMTSMEHWYGLPEALF
ncbi:MAG: amidohydrolase family protein, partial [Polaribacter sp.]|nr:amidohydrolase family protein [Polaribacter sp.]